MAIDWERIECLVGFENIEAPVVLIGPEEHLDSVHTLGSELALRSTFEPVMLLAMAPRARRHGIILSPPAFSKWREGLRADPETAL